LVANTLTFNITLFMKRLTIMIFNMFIKALGRLKLEDPWNEMGFTLFDNKQSWSIEKVSNIFGGLQLAWELERPKRRVVLLQWPFVLWALAHCPDEQTLYSRRPRKRTGVHIYLSITYKQWLNMFCPLPSSRC